MKKLIISLILFFAITEITNAQSPDFSWAYNSGWIGGVGGSGHLAYDGNGNIYMANDFSSSSVAFDNVTLTNCSWNSNSTIALVKSDTSGNVIWAKTACGHFNYIKPKSIATDQLGNVYVTGYFKGDSITFGSVTLKTPFSTGFYDNMFVVKYAPDGNVLWGKCARGNNSNGSCSGNGIALDPNGNAYVIGNFSSSNIIFDQDTLHNTTNPSFTDDVFILKLDPAGNTLWTISEGGSNNDIGNSISVDNNSLYITGNFLSKTIDLSGTILANYDTTGNYNNLFYAKYDSAGNIIWAKGNKTDGNSIGVGITSSSTGMLYLTGNFGSKKIIFGNDTLINPIGGSDLNLFCAALDAIGNPIWAKSPQETYHATVSSIATDVNGNVYLTGQYGSENITFGNTTLINNYSGYEDIFIVKYNSLGNVAWAKSVGGKENDFGKGITTANGSVYVAGIFWSPSIIFGYINLSAHPAPFGGGDDIYIAKLSGACTAVNVIQQPGNQFKLVGDVATFNVSASGSPYIFYQWYKNNYPILNATGSSYSTPMLESFDNGNTYYCLVSNCSYSNSVKSTVDTLEVCSRSSIVYQSGNKTAAPGDSVTFNVVVSGSSPFSYQWFNNGTSIVGATNSSYTTPKLTPADSGHVFHCIITNCRGSGVTQSFDMILAIITETGINELTDLENNIDIYPNPTYDNIYINSLYKIEDIKIIDIIGQVVYHSKIPHQNYSLTIEKAGIYYLVVSTKQGSIIRKIVKVD